jgi:hypothetical protein
MHYGVIFLRQCSKTINEIFVCVFMSSRCLVVFNCKQTFVNRSLVIFLSDNIKENLFEKDTNTSKLHS